MDLALSEEQTELASTVRAVLAKRSDSRAVRAAMVSPQGHDADLWSTLTEQIGVAALAVPEQYDGVGASLLETMVVLDELGRALTPSPLLASAVAAEVLLAAADDDARARLLPRLAAGEVAAWGDCVDDGSDGTVARDVLWGDVATVLLVTTDDGLWEVDPAAAERTWTPTMDQTTRLATVGVDLATATRIGDGPAARDRAALVGAVGVAALATGLAAQSLETTVAYTQVREQFGRPIGSFQALKHRMADLLVLVEVARSASLAASYAVAAGRADARRLAHVAKSCCCDALDRVAAEMVQMHGGIAITWEHDAHLVLKRAHLLAQLFGPAREHRRLLEL